MIFLANIKQVLTISLLLVSRFLCANSLSSIALLFAVVGFQHMFARNLPCSNQRKTWGCSTSNCFALAPAWLKDWVCIDPNLDSSCLQNTKSNSGNRIGEGWWWCSGRDSKIRWTSCWRWKRNFESSTSSTSMAMCQTWLGHCKDHVDTHAVLTTLRCVKIFDHQTLWWSKTLGIWCVY